MANKQYFEQLKPGEASIESRSGAKLILKNDGSLNINSALQPSEYELLAINGGQNNIEFDLNQVTSGVYMGSNTSSNINLNQNTQGNSTQLSLNIQNKHDNIITPQNKIGVQEIIIPPFEESSIGIPVINSFEPKSGKSNQDITIKGINFEGVRSVKFGGIEAQDIQIQSPTEIIAIVSSSGRTGKITVTNKLGTGVSEETFTWLDSDNIPLPENEDDLTAENDGNGDENAVEGVEPEETEEKGEFTTGKTLITPKKNIGRPSGIGGGGGGGEEISKKGKYRGKSGPVTQCGGKDGVAVFTKSGVIDNDDIAYWDKVWFKGSTVVDCAMNMNPFNMPMVNPNVERFFKGSKPHQRLCKNFFPGADTSWAFCAMGNSSMFVIANQGYKGNIQNSGGFPLCTSSQYVRLNLCKKFILVRNEHYDDNGLKKQYLEEFKNFTSTYAGTYYTAQRSDNSYRGHTGIVLGIEAKVNPTNSNYYTVRYYTLDFNAGGGKLKLCVRRLGAGWGWGGSIYDVSTTFADVGSYPGGRFHPNAGGAWVDQIYRGLGAKDSNGVPTAGSWIDNKSKFSGSKLGGSGW